jgi:hypothetical protein
MRDSTGAINQLVPTGLIPVDLDSEGKIFVYIKDENLHRLDLVSGLDLVIANSVESASFSR